MANQQQSGPMDSYLLGKESLSVTVSGRVSSIQTSKTSYKILIEQVHYEQTQLTSKYILVYAKDCANLSIGNGVCIKGDLSFFQSPTNAYQFDQAAYYKIQDIDYKLYASTITKMDNQINMLSDKLYRLRLSCFSVFNRIEEEPVAQSLSAMLLGEKSVLEEETKELYQAAGIAHIISISGLHVALLGMALFNLIKRLIGLKTGVIATILFIFCYGILTNFSISTNRAVIMLMLLLAAKLAGRTYDLLSAVSLSGLFILIRQPMQVYQCGFLLSYGAILGIAIVNPCIMGLFDEERLKNGTNWNDKQFSVKKERIRAAVLTLRYYMVKTLVLQSSIFVVTIPILLWFYYKTASYAFLLNLIVLPLMCYVVAFGVAGALGGCIYLPVGRMLLLPASYIIRFYLLLCDVVAALPFHYLVPGKPQLWKIAVYLVLVVIACLLLYRKYRLGVLVICVGISLFFIHIPQGKLKITSIDVGQGDCYIIQTPTDHVYVMDGGSTSEDKVGEYRLLPYLYGSGINKIEYIFVSHADKDHISGVEELLCAVKKKEFSIKGLIVAKTSFQDDNYDSLVAMAADCGVSIGYMEAGGVVTEGELCITCLHPTYEYMPTEANDYSLVLSLTYREFSMLFTGDLTSEAESELFRHNDIQQYDVLKVAHHGSKYSSSEQLLKLVSPKVALISCGKSNHYGHPHKELLERLDNIGAKAFITKDSGMITVTSDGESITIEEYLASSG